MENVEAGKFSLRISAKKLRITELVNVMASTQD